MNTYCEKSIKYYWDVRIQFDDIMYQVPTIPSSFDNFSIFLIDVERYIYQHTNICHSYIK